MNVTVGNVHFPTVIAAVVIVLGILAAFGLILRLLKKL